MVITKYKMRLKLFKPVFTNTFQTLPDIRSGAKYKIGYGSAWSCINLQECFFANLVINIDIFVLKFLMDMRF